MEQEFIKEGKIFHGTIPVVMGTKLEFLAVGEEEPAVSPVWEWLGERSMHLDRVLSVFDPRSEVSAFNSRYDEGPQEVSRDLMDMVLTAKRYFYRTGGLFDAACGRMPLIDVADDGCLCKQDPSVRLDFGGIAKGYLMAELKAELEETGIRRAFVNFGDSAILAVGSHPFGDCWKVGLKDPFGGGVLAEVALVDCALSTSGNTPGYTGHIFNPHTGKPNLEKKVTCVKCADPLDAEVLSTVLMIADEAQRGILEREFPGAEMKTYNL